MAEIDRFVRFADVATLVVCCGAGTTFAGSEFMFCIVFGIEFLAVCFDCFVLTSIVCLVVVDVVMGIDGLHETGRFYTSCTVNVAHAFASGMGDGFLMSCFCVVCCDAGAVFVFFSASILFG